MDAINNKIIRTDIDEPSWMILVAEAKRLGIRRENYYRNVLALEAKNLKTAQEKTG